MRRPRSAATCAASELAPRSATTCAATCGAQEVRCDGGGGALEERNEKRGWLGALAVPRCSRRWRCPSALGGDKNEKKGWLKPGSKKTDAPSVFWEPDYLVYGGLQWPG